MLASNDTTSNFPNRLSSASIHVRTAWGGVDAEHPFTLLHNKDEVPPLSVLILVGVLLTVYTLLNIPRLFARWYSDKQGGEMFNGMHLSSKPPAPSATVVGGGIALSQTPTSSRSRAFISKEGDSPGYPSPIYQTPTTATPTRSFNTYPSPSTERLIRRVDSPRYIPNLSSKLPFSGYMEIRVPVTGMTVGQVFICIIWAGLVTLALFYDNDIVKAPVRAGFVATNQLPIVFLLAGKVNWIGYLIGKGYEKINFLHRFVGRCLFVAATFHAGGYLNKWLRKGGIAYVSESSRIPFITAGIVAWAAFGFMGITALPIIRRRMYGFFWISHWIGFVTAIIALSFHKPYTGLLATICLLLYTKDLILRLFIKTRIVPAKIIALPAPSSCLPEGSTQIILPLRSGWRAGQHVFLRVPALQEMGGMAWLENHPFTIGSAEGGEMILMAKKAGGWTRDLYDFAAKGGVSQAPREDVGEQNDVGYEGEKRDLATLERAEEVVGRECKILVEGPYGGPCSTIFSSYSGITLISGGSGITYSLAMFQDLIKKASENHVRAAAIHLVWIVKTYEHATPLLSHLENLCIRAEMQSTIDPGITIYISRATSSKRFQHRGVEVKAERPDLPRLVRDDVTRTRGEALSGGVGTCGMIIGVCGPRRLIDGTRMAVRSIPWKEKKDVGGVTVHTETFGW
ncbi:uncharacterized protein IL334_000330 [Kwoniella shivajii]|uniref:FAD-binding FR-type domain-containing protein n=1 Tax=Kwoniella shivajii TaxID=564305 RepID=A0ABZ1CQD6_9TREE|nr:hypothetical protein IL334_000330 [Kwoniella shivajii]